MATNSSKFLSSCLSSPQVRHSLAQVPAPSRCVCCHVGPLQRRPRLGEDPNGRKKARTGLLAEVDPNAPLMKPIVGNTEEDYTIRSKNRYESDLIWNTNWQNRAELEDQREAEKSQPKAAAPENDGSGFLSFSRVADLNDMSVDLSKQLMEKPKPLVKQRSEASQVPMRPVARTGEAYSNPPTASEARAWSRSGGYRNRSAAIEPQEATPEQAMDAAQQWDQTKRENQLWTTGTAAVCFAATYAFYTKDIAASYLVGALGGIVYLRLLGRTVDSVGADSLGSAAGGAAAQPRLLIPVILGLLYNRYNTLYADANGVHLEFLPMLAGFFTYKVGVLARSSISVYQEMKAGNSGN